MSAAMGDAGAGQVSLAGVSIRLGEGAATIEAVREISLEVAPGEFLVVLGPSGCGKSTLLGALAGFLSTARGEVRVDGRVVTAPGPDRGMVFQQHTLLPWRSVRDNVALGLKFRGLSRRSREARAQELIELVGLTGFEDVYPAQLSGGMQQRVELARALITQPSVILMDEPFGALDAQTRVRMQELLLSISARLRPTIVFVTHDIDEAIFLADRIVVLTDRPGRIRAELPVPLPRPRAAEVLTSPAVIELRRHCLRLLRAPEFPSAPDHELAERVSS